MKDEISLGNFLLKWIDKKTFYIYASVLCLQRFYNQNWQSTEKPNQPLQKKLVLPNFVYFVQIS